MMNKCTKKIQKVLQSSYIQVDEDPLEKVIHEYILEKIAASRGVKDLNYYDGTEYAKTYIESLEEIEYLKYVYAKKKKRKKIY